MTCAPTCGRRSAAWRRCSIGCGRRWDRRTQPPRSRPSSRPPATSSIWPKKARREWSGSRTSASWSPAPPRGRRSRIPTRPRAPALPSSASSPKLRLSRPWTRIRTSPESRSSPRTWPRDSSGRSSRSRVWRMDCFRWVAPPTSRAASKRSDDSVTWVSRARETHVTESSLLFDAARLVGGATQRKQSILQTRERDDRPLESLGHVRGEERDSGLVLILVHGRDKRSLGKVALDGSAGALGRVGILDLRPRRGAGDQLADVLDPLHSLRAFFGQILLVAGGREDGLERGGWVRLSHRLPQAIEQRRDAAERLAHVWAQVVHAAGTARRLEQRLPPPRGRPAEHREGSVADATPGDVHHSKEGLIVGRVGDQPQVGKQILYLAPFVEADRADEAVRNATEPKRLFERTRLGVGAVEDRHPFVCDVALCRTAGELARQPFRFIALIGCAQQRHWIAALLLREERLAQARGVFGDDAVRGVEDDLRGPIVLLEPHELGAGKVVLEREHVTDVGAAPSINRLIVVTYHTEIAVPLGKMFDQQVLRGVRVLELVHEDVLKPVLPIRQAFRMLAEQGEGVEQEIVEVHGVGLLQRRSQRGVDIGRDLHQRRVRLCPKLVGCQP